MTMIRVVGDDTIWPYSLGQLRQDEPTKSFSIAPSDAELAVFGVFRVQSAAAPEFDPAIEKVVEVQPVLVDSAWLQTWEVLELTDAEQEAYFRAMHPPQWQAFGRAVWGMAEVNQLLATALQGAPALAMALPVGLGQAAQGDQATFLNAWQAARTVGLVAAELVTALQGLAGTHYLPAAFVEGLGDPPWQWPTEPARFDEWTAPDGSVWIWDQPRDELGQYVADDLETEAVESALRWLPVEVE